MPNDTSVGKALTAIVAFRKKARMPNSALIGKAYTAIGELFGGK